MRFFLSLLTAGLTLVAASSQTLDLFHVKSPTTNQMVDAVHFLNESTFIVTPSTVPWDSQNTLTFSNMNTMAGNIGFRFDHVDSDFFGFRRPADIFYNGPGALINAYDGGGIAPLIGGVFTDVFFVPDVSYITVNAYSITNRGDISVGAAGLIGLNGRSVDVTGGTLFVEDVNSSLSTGLGFGGNVTETNFFPSAGVYDLGWGLGIDTNMNNFNLVLSTDPNTTITPPFSITNYLDILFCENTSFINTNAQVWVREFEGPGGTNLTIQVVSVSTADPDIEVFTSFIPLVLPRGTPQGGYFSPLVEFRVASTNFRTLEMQTNSLNFFSQLWHPENAGLGCKVHIQVGNVDDGAL